MSKLQIFLFCGVCLVLSAAVIGVLYPHATVTQQTLKYASTPQAMEDMPDINLGSSFGELPVTVLVGYYLDNPPQANNAQTSKHEQQFGGC